jgi:hypothetical protein
LSPVVGLPVDLSLTVGDAIHNLSSSLDAMVSQLMAERTGKPNKRTTFPVHNTLDQLRRSFENSAPAPCGCGAGSVERKGANYQIRQYAPELETLILDVFKPCASENSILYAIRKADNWDKHNMLLIVVGGLMSHGLNFSTNEGSIHQHNSIDIPAGQRIRVGVSKHPFKVSSEGVREPRLFFAGEVPIAGKPVVDWLKRAHFAVMHVLMEMERAFGTLVETADDVEVTAD